MANLTWKFLYVTYNCGDSSQNWVRNISPTAGTEGDSAVTVTVDAATSTSDCLSATISISASTGEIETIDVERCKFSCSTCSDFGISITSETFPSSGKTGAELGRYNTGISTSCMKVTSSSSALSNIRLNSGRIIGDISENNGSDRIFRLDVYDSDGNTCGNYELRQKGVGSCSEACNSVVVTFANGRTEITDIPESGGTFNLNIEYNRNCLRTPVITVDGSDGVSVDVTRKTLTVLPLGESDRDITVNFKFVNATTGEVCPIKKLTIKQEGESCEYEISGGGESEGCDNINVTFTAIKK